MSSFNVHWYNDEHTIIAIDVTQNWTWEDAYECVKQQVELMESVDYLVHTFFHFHNVPTVPQGFGLPHLAKLIKTRAPNEGVVIFVGTHTLLQMIINAITTVYSMDELTAKYHFVAKLDEALTIIGKYEAEKV